MINLNNYQNLNNAFNNFNSELVETYRASLKNNDRLASKHLYNDISTDIEVDGDVVNLTITLQDYHKYVEHGRNKGKFPPTDAISQWIKDKGITPRPDRNGKLPTQKQLVYLIGRKISREGWKGSEDMQQSVEKIKQKYIDAFKDALIKDFNNIIKTNIQLL